MSSIRRTGKRREIAHRIRSRRLALGLTQREVAARLRTTQITWSLIEHGKQSVPAERLGEICAILQMTPDEVVGVAELQSAAA